MDRKKKKVAGLPTRTLDSVKDKRFAQVLKNPVYRPVPKKEKKVEIDKRFQSMFTDDRFKLKYKVDKRGRPVETTTDENLRRYYDLEEDEEEEGKLKVKDKDEDESLSEGSEEDDNSEGDSDIEGDVQEEDITTPLKSKGTQKLDEVTRKKLHSVKVDYARGEADLTESSSEDESSSDEDNDEPLDHGWGEMDKDAARTEESTNRLALCNMDWDRVRAVDLLILLNSFLPPGGVIKSVNIYPSEFGKERMAEEDVQGPRELRDIKVKSEADIEDEDYSENDSESPNEEDEDEEGSQYHREKLRQYQLNRLKYYYAVIEFDSTAAAEKVYSECDGMEYESSAAKIDLRFIPDDMTFEDKPKDTCTAIPDGAKYRPRFFTTTALQQVKVDLTWDETDPMRKELTEKIFDPKEKVDDDDIRAYLATSSEDESENEEENDGIKIEADSDAEEGEKDEPTEKKPKDSKQDAISKYKALLQSIETEKKKKENDVEMEITWGVGLKETTEKLVKKKMEEVEKSKRTPWEEQLDKRKEKRSKRKEERKKKTTENDSDSNDSSVDSEEEDQPFSDDDVDVDMADEFFQSELKSNDIFKEGNAKNKKKPKEKKIEKTGSKGKTDAALELLLMDEDDNKRHFSLKQIMEEENDSKSKKKRKNKKRRKLEEGEKQAKMAKDDFEIDVEDNRFAALFNSHHFNVDPSDPNFKKTKAMGRIIEEKQKRRIAGSLEFEEKQFAKRQNNAPSSNISGSNTKNASLDKCSSKTAAELSYLVKSIKRNTENLNKSKKGMKPKHK